MLTNQYFLFTRASRIFIPALAAFLIAAMAAPALAQPVADPRIVEFSPSADHNVTLTSGQAAVTKYNFEVYQTGASAPFHTVDMGKPAPQTDGLIRYDFSSGVSGWPLPGGVYESRVAAVGPLGTGRSALSNQFTMNGGSTCTYTVSPATVAVAATAGTASVSVSTGTGCAWTASDSVGWLSVSPASGTGSGTVTVTVTANSSTSSRSATATIAGQSVSITQAGAAANCYSVVSPTTISAPAAGSSTSVFVQDEVGCAWTTSSTVSWVTLSPTSGVGTGTSQTVTVTVAPNTTTSSRSTSIAIANRGVTITQAAGTATCTYTVSPTTVSIAAGGGNSSVNVTAGSGCAWTVTGLPAWITASPASGSANGTVTLTVAANTATTTRSATITVAGKAVSVSQAGVSASCTYTVSPTTVSIAAGGGNSSLNVTAGSGCAWTVTGLPAWITASPANGSGNGTVTLTMAANSASTTRNATITVATKQVSVSQAGVSALCSYTVAPMSLSVTAAGGAQTVGVTTTTGCGWTVSSLPAWVTASPTSGSGSKSVTLTVAVNATGAPRTATISVAGKPVSVSQSATSSSPADTDGDSMPDDWETFFGLNPASASDATLDPDGDGVINRDEYTAQTHPRGDYRRQFAEGTTVAPFRTEFALLNLSSKTARVLVRFVTTDGRVIGWRLQVGANRRASLAAADVPGLAGTAFGATIESDQKIAAEREITWGAPVYGSHSDSGTATLSATWYLAEGTTRTGYDLFYSLSNTKGGACQVDVTYLRPAPQAAITKRYSLAANRRLTIRVKDQDPGLVNTDIAAIVKTTNGQKIVVERTMYYTTGGVTNVAGLAGAGSHTLAKQWYFAEGTTGASSDTYLILGNASAGSSARVRATYLLPSGQTVGRTYDVEPRSRRTILVDGEASALAATSVSISLATLNDVAFFAERTVAWPGGTAGWQEVHNSPGATATGWSWAIAGGETGGPESAETIVRVANTSTIAGPVRVRLRFEDGTATEKTYTVPKTSSFTVNVNSQFPEAAGRAYGVQVESTGSTKLALVVESTVYRGANRAAGSNAIATKVN